MGSKLEYRSLLTKIAVVVLDVMIEDGVGVVVPALDDSRWFLLWHVLVVGSFSSATFSNPSIFQSPIPMQVWILGFPIHEKSLPIAQNSSNCQIFIYYGGNWKIQKTPNCSKFSQFTQKSPNFQSRSKFSQFTQ
jgi:hypothetical protein